MTSSRIPYVLNGSVDHRCNLWVAANEIRYPELPERLEVVVHVKIPSGHFSYTFVRGRLCTSILVENPINHEILLLWSQSLLVLMSYRMWLLALQSAAQCRFGDTVRSSSLSLTPKKHQIENLR